MNEMNDTFEFIRMNTIVIDLDEDLAKRAGETDYIMKKKIRNWPVADSIVYTVATAGDAELVTGDPHFKALENVIIL